ncbi:hypothetical protein ACSFM0_001101 [Escherichia coli]|uniref:hypothetical protein n=1 Tax=Escherichia coli TaxID=562 RepID=UPI000FB9CC84|nr:hypothetical protein [Escherichia coli]EED1399096.1 hypothetical protein [Escherichia coli]EFI8018925.1 hypothetical protein [Escherichia coli]EFN7330738.1 hypothetical protein [Escherichia coli]EIA0494723.1 hypothetical protein [Escherichia coli]EKL0118056.1 hypothetical protein [Escherichia coli]
MNDRSPTEIIHGIIEEQEERELTLMIEEQIERQRKQEATQLDKTPERGPVPVEEAGAGTVEKCSNASK